MASPRALKLADQIKVITAEMLERRVKDPRLGFVTVTDVRLTGDNREATVFYTVMGNDTEREESAVALRSATGLIRSTIGKRLGLRFAPTLAFVPDVVPETARQFNELLERTRAQDAEVAGRAVPGAYAGEPDPYRKPREGDPEFDVEASEAEHTDDELVDLADFARDTTGGPDGNPVPPEDR